ncbi:receptor-transporting protein 2-like [Galendromus occidentalis]|uniref:Receptor-transporting protein 2-like n=1 Tax=Galendromus occidentalis TaxID=34638 RepID=A0AAJ6QUC2_9ACAR|nr:receptor-transporting protein 2-like [Galendromus occidentalis]
MSTNFDARERYRVESQIFSNVMENSKYLEPIARAFPVPQKFRFTRAFGKAFFRCSRCHHEWTSRNTLVTFDIRDEKLVKVWKQACSQCVKQAGRSTKGDNSAFYQRPVGFGVDDLIELSQCAIQNFLYKIGYVNEKQRGVPDSSHRSELCEACADGCCPTMR